MSLSTSRRSFLQQSALATAGLLAGPACFSQGQNGREPLPVAGVTTVYRRGSHAHVILGKILEGFDQLGGAGPDLRLVSLYVDQFSDRDMSRGLADKYGFRLCDSIDEAINLGGSQVGVSGVLSIGEHGSYPHDPVTGQRKYPRKRFFDEIVAAMQRGGRCVPLFNDKHLSYRTDDALQMYQTANELGIPFMAGSSVPVAWRIPPLQLPLDCELEGAVAIGYGGDESYGFHTLETLQCMVERRKGGETGVARVRAVRGNAILESEAEGYFSVELLTAALRAQSEKIPANLLERIVDNGGPFYLIDYRDGFKACVAMLRGMVRKFSFACQLKDHPAPVATWFALQDGPPYQHFGWLVKAIEAMVHSGRPSYPVERTLLTTVVLDAAMHSLAEGGRSIATPGLKIAYRAAPWTHAPGVPPKTRAW